MITRENTDIIKRPIVCAHKSFCFPVGMNYTKQREKARQRACK